MRIHKRIISVVVLISILTLVSCSGGGGGGGGGELNSTWITDPPSLTVSGWSKEDTSTPDHIINTAQTDAQIMADLQTAFDAGGIIVFDNVAPITINATTTLNVPIYAVDNPHVVILDGKGTVTFDGGGTTQIIEKEYQTELTVQNLRFQNCVADGATADERSGGAINVVNWDGYLTVIDCEFENCRAGNDIDQGPDIGGGAIRATGQKHLIISGSTFNNCSGSNGGAVCSLGCQVTILNSSFTNNTAFGTGGGADQGPSGQGGIGGAVYTDGVDQNADEPKHRIEGCLFQNNSAEDHAGAFFAYTRSGTGSSTYINACTFDSNSVTDAGAAVGQAGAIYSQYADLMITNTTFSNNSSQGSGGGLIIHTPRKIRIANCTFFNNSAVGLGGAISMGSETAYISSCTFADNYATVFGGGIRTGSSPDVWIKNCLFSDNWAGDQWNGHAVTHTLKDGGGNVQWPQYKLNWPANEDVHATATVLLSDPNLQALSDNGGPTQTMSILTGSPAEDAGTDTSCSASDQRGLPRNGTCDAGAFEIQ